MQIILIGVHIGGITLDLSGDLPYKALLRGQKFPIWLGSQRVLESAGPPQTVGHTNVSNRVLSCGADEWPGWSRVTTRDDWRSGLVGGRSATRRESPPVEHDRPSAARERDRRRGSRPLRHSSRFDPQHPTPRRSRTVRIDTGRPDGFGGPHRPPCERSAGWMPRLHTPGCSGHAAQPRKAAEMDFRQLEYFKAVVEAGSVSRAAKNLR